MPKSGKYSILFSVLTGYLIIFATNLVIVCKGESLYLLYLDLQPYGIIIVNVGEMTRIFTLSDVQNSKLFYDTGIWFYLAKKILDGKILY